MYSLPRCLGSGKLDAAFEFSHGNGFMQCNALETTVSGTYSGNTIAVLKCLYLLNLKRDLSHYGQGSRDHDRVKREVSAKAP
jgi:hypothetical protein